MIKSALNFLDINIKMLGYVVVILILSFMGFWDWITARVDAIYYYAYNWEQFGWTSVALRWAMLLSTVYVITTYIMKVINNEFK